MGKPSVAKKAKKKEEAPVLQEEAVLVRPTPAAPLATNPTESQLIPFDGTGVEKVLALDLQAQQREHDSIYPQSRLSVSFGQQVLASGNYKLIKDEDTFTNVGSATLNGATVEFSPRWQVGLLSRGIAESFLGFSIATGYFQSDVSVNRSGVQSGLQQYKYQLFPVDLSFQAGIDLWRRGGIYVSYGLGGEILHQTGYGLMDSVTEFFYGEVATFGAFGNINRSLQIFINYKIRGPRVLIRNSTISGSMLLVGISIALTG